ncbi:MAG: hypothetical protein LBV00_03450 [Propionibacteriaceae bacterium]|jgi:multidrug efflux pump subunit AcrA (membrane-fusion protein)|nr:hypothetical protein [Propionibacteriaceae bacterium]
MKPPATTPDRVIHRQRIMLIIMVVALLVCVAGLIAVWNIKSPAQQAAGQAPPPPSVLTAEVKNEVLAQQVIMRGTVVSDTINIRSLSTASPPIITATPKSGGDQIAEGDLLIEVAGRPVIALTGPTPAWRALGPDLVGKDVSELQEALQRLGQLSDFKAGTFDQRTGKAVEALYKDRGYAPSCDRSPVAVCLGEVVFLPSLPVTVTSRDANVGDDATTTKTGLITIQSGEATVSATIPAGQQTGLTAGLPVLVTDDASNRECQGSLANLGALTAGSDQQSQGGGGSGGGAGGAGYPATITASGCLDATWLNLNVRISIQVQATPQAVLAVPTTAIRTDAGAHTYVTVHPADGGEDRRVDVTPGLIAQGQVEVTPASGQTLSEGDLVVVA